MPWDSVDIVEEQDEYKKHVVDSFCLWPLKWQQCKPPVVLSWAICKLEDKELRNIPIGPGIYTLLIQPGIAAHPSCSYLMYVGQAMNLRARFRKYLTTERRKRPKVFRLLIKWEGYIYFCFTHARKEELKAVEDELIGAFLPPVNSMFPGRLRAVKDAF